MNKVFKKMTGRTFVSNFKQFISVILIVFLSTMLLSGFLTNYSMLNNTITTYFEETNLADAWFYVDKVTTQDEQFFIDSNIHYEKRLYIETKMEISDSSVSNNGKIYVYDGKISNPYRETGMWGCVIDKKVAEDNNLTIGFDQVKINFEHMINGQIIEIDCFFQITGTMCLDECANVSTAWPIFITKEHFLSEINSRLFEITNDETMKFDEVPYNQILVKTNRSNKNIDEIITNVKNYYDTANDTKLSYVFKQDTIESVVMLTDEIKQTKKMIYVFPLIFLLVSVLVILTTIDQLVLQERQRIGTLKSIGIPDKKIINHYSQFGAILCAIGSVLGSLFGVMLVPGIMFIKYTLVYSIPNDYISLTIPHLWILLSICLVTILGYIVARFACQSVMKKKPIECLKFQINNSKIYSKKNKILSKAPFSLKMAIRNIRLKPIRTVMAIIGIAGCVALLLCGFGIGDTLDNSVTYDFGDNFRYDITTTYIKDNFEEELKKMEGLLSYENYQKMYVIAKNGSYQKNINLFKIQEKSFLSRIHLDKGKVVISKGIADELNVSDGDTVTLILGGKERELQISSTFETSIMNGIFVCEELGFDDIYKINGMWISCVNISQEKVDYVNSINGTNTATTLSGMVDGMDTKLSSINVMTTTLKIFAVALAVVVLLNLVFLIFKERIREIATLKVIGRDIFSILLSLFYEILFMGFIGSLFGICLGYPLLVAVLSINKVDILHYIYNIKFSSFFFSFIIVVLTIISIMGFCYLKIKKINMIESLKSSE